MAATTMINENNFVLYNPIEVRKENTKSFSEMTEEERAKLLARFSESTRPHTRSHDATARRDYQKYESKIVKAQIKHFAIVMLIMAVAVLSIVYMSNMIYRIDYSMSAIALGIIFDLGIIFISVVLAKYVKFSICNKLKVSLREFNEVEPEFWRTPDDEKEDIDIKIERHYRR